MTCSSVLLYISYTTLTILLATVIVQQYSARSNIHLAMVISSETRSISSHTNRVSSHVADAVSLSEDAEASEAESAPVDIVPPKPKRMRIAFVCSGHFRNIESHILSFRTVILDSVAEYADADLFLCTDVDLRPDHPLHHTISSFVTEGKLKNFRTFFDISAHNQFHRMERCFDFGVEQTRQIYPDDLKNDEDRNTMYAYDWIVRTRPDHVYGAPAVDFRTMDNSKLYVRVRSVLYYPKAWSSIQMTLAHWSYLWDGPCLDVACDQNCLRQTQCMVLDDQTGAMGPQRAKQFFRFFSQINSIPPNPPNEMDACWFARGWAEGPWTRYQLHFLDGYRTLDGDPKDATLMPLAWNVRLRGPHQTWVCRPDCFDPVPPKPKGCPTRN